MKIRPLPGLRDCLEGSVIDTGVAPQAADPTGMPVWQIILIVVDVIAAAAFIALEVLILKGAKKRGSAPAGKGKRK